MSTVVEYLSGICKMVVCSSLERQLYCRIRRARWTFLFGNKSLVLLEVDGIPTTTFPSIGPIRMGTGASLRLFWRRPLSTQWTCQQCRKFQGGVSLLSGHNRWSKIKHDKGKNDAAKSKQRSFLAKEIIQASKRKNERSFCCNDCG